MSLICGILSRKDPDLASAENLAPMLAATLHRERDGQAIYVEPGDGIALALSYTATFGRDKGDPPWYENDGAVLAVDGDIYRDGVQGRATPLRAESGGSESTLTPLGSEGDAQLSGCDGTFTLFQWNKRSKTLYLASDRLGHKLLYYYVDQSEDLLVFSTELKGVLAHPSVPRSLEERALPLYLSLGYISAPFTLVKGMRKMLPAECRAFAPSGMTARRYWMPSLLQSGGSFDDWAQATRREMAQAVRRTLGRTGSVGVYLSGGIDSSALLAAVKEQGVAEVRAFTLAYAGHRSEYDLSWAEHVARVTGTPHEVHVIDAEKEITPELLTPLLGCVDEPFNSQARIVNEYILGTAAARFGINSTLSGGYAGWVFSMVRQRELIERGEYPASLDGRMAALLGGVEFSEKRIAAALGPAAQDLSFVAEAPLANRELVRHLDELRGPDLALLMRSSAAAGSLFYQHIPPLLGMEERSPFLDARLVEFAVSAPPAFRGLGLGGGDRTLLQRAFEQELQMDFNKRAKRAFPNAPLPSWLIHMYVPSLRALAADGILQEKYLVALLSGLRAGKKRAKKEASQWFFLYWWYQVHIKQTDPIAAVA